MPETLLDAETSMTGTRVSVIKELSVVWGRKRSKRWEIVLISQTSQSLGIAMGIAAGPQAGPGFLLSQEGHLPSKHDTAAPGPSFGAAYICAKNKAHTHTHMHACMHPHAHTRAHTCFHTRTHTCTHVLHAHMHTADQG